MSMMPANSEKEMMKRMMAKMMTLKVLERDLTIVLRTNSCGISKYTVRESSAGSYCMTRDICSSLRTFSSMLSRICL